MSLIFATQLTAVATAVLAVFAIITGIYAIRAFRKQSLEVSAIEQQVTDQQELTRQQGEILKVQSHHLEVQRKQLAEQHQAHEEQAVVLGLQAKEISASLKQRERDAEEQRRKQAARVTAWFQAGETGWIEDPRLTGELRGRARIRNASDEPVFNVRVFFHHMREKEDGGYQAVSQGGPPPRETIGVLPPGEDRFVAIPQNVRVMFGSTTIDDRTCAASIESPTPRGTGGNATRAARSFPVPDHSAAAMTPSLLKVEEGKRRAAPARKMPRGGALRKYRRLGRGPSTDRSR